MMVLNDCCSCAKPCPANAINATASAHDLFTRFLLLPSHPIGCADINRGARGASPVLPPGAAQRRAAKKVRNKAAASLSPMLPKTSGRCRQVGAEKKRTPFSTAPPLG